MKCNSLNSLYLTVSKPGIHASIKCLMARSKLSFETLLEKTARVNLKGIQNNVRCLSASTVSNSVFAIDLCSFYSVYLQK